MERAEHVARGVDREHPARGCAGGGLPADDVGGLADRSRRGVHERLGQATDPGRATVHRVEAQHRIGGAGLRAAAGYHEPAPDGRDCGIPQALGHMAGDPCRPPAGIGQYAV